MSAAGIYLPEADRYECSQECLRVLGLTDAQQLRTAADQQSLIHPDDRDAVRRSVRDTLRHYRQGEVDILHIASGAAMAGSCMSIPAHPSPQPMHKAPLDISGTVQDVTQHHDLEDALRNSEARAIAASPHKVGALHLEWTLSQAMLCRSTAPSRRCWDISPPNCQWTSTQSRCWCTPTIRLANAYHVAAGS